MPAVTENTMVDSKGEVVTDFIDSVGTSSVSYTYTNTQTSLYIRNDSDVSITVTVNGSPTTVTRLSDTTITAEFTSFSIVSASGIASFYARSLRGVPTNTTSTSQLNVISGTAASPSITAIADANTGIFFPASETIAFSTNGSERVRINSSGNVGIGTTSPTNKLQIDGVTANTSCINAVANTTAGQSFGIALSAGTNSSDYALNIRNAAQTSQLFHITGAGNVGIGTTSPDVFSRSYSGTILGISSSGQSAIELNSATGNKAFIDIGVAGTRRGYFTGSATEIELGSATAIPLYLITNNNICATITSAGNVGIGTTSPTALVSMHGAPQATSGAILTLRDTSATGANTTYGAITFISSPGTDFSIGKASENANSALAFRNANTGAEFMRITSAGNVGIGTTSPSNKLQVVSSSASTIGITTTTAGSEATPATINLSFYGYNNEERGRIRVLDQSANNYNTKMIFYTSTDPTNTMTERMQLSSSGYLLIGYTSSNGAYPLQVNGQIFATSSTIATSDGRYKKDVVSLDGALDIVKALNPVQFSWKEHPVHKFNTEVPTVGFIAQEVEQVLADKSYLTSIIKKSECTWETETGEFVEREVTRDVEKQVTREVEREITETIDGEEVTRTITEEIIETIIEQVTEIVSEPVKETHTEEFLGIAESNLIAILTKAVKELTAKVEALEAQLNGN